jgi:hypothetical protein
MTKNRIYRLRFDYIRPYPFDRTYEIKASNMGTAMTRGFKLLRKAERGKRIKQIDLKIIDLGEVILVN